MVQGGENNLAHLSIGQTLTGFRRNNLEVEIGFTQMVSHVRLAIHAAGQSHFGRAIMLKDLNAGSLAKHIHNAFRHMVAAQNSGAKTVKYPIGKGAVASGEREYLDRETDDARRSLLLHVLEGFGGIDGKSMRDRDDAGAGDALGELITNAAFALAGKCNQHPVSARGHGGDAMPKEIHCQFLVFRGEEDALWRAAGAA